jgi:hypothetical protein
MTGIQVRTELRYHSNMQIKIASVTDAEAIASLAQDLARYHISQDFSLEGRQNLDDALSADAMRRYMSEGCRFHVAVADDVLQGIVAMRWIRWGADGQCCTRCHGNVREIRI